MSGKVITHTTIHLINIKMLLSTVIKVLLPDEDLKTPVIPCVRGSWVVVSSQPRPFDPTSVNDVTLSDTRTELASDNVQKCKYILWT